MKYKPARLRSVALALFLTQAGAAPAETPSATRTLDAGALTQAAEAALRERLSRSAARVELHPRHAPDAIVVPDGRLTIRGEADDGAWSPTMRALAVIEIDGRAVRRVPVWFSVRAYAPGPLAARELATGEVLGEADLQLGEIDLAAAGQAAPTAPVELLGKRLRHRLAQGAAISARAVEPVPEVSRGGRVIVQLKDSGVDIQAPGVALADARRGDRVRVRMTRQDVLTATVTGPQRARIDQETRP